MMLKPRRAEGEKDICSNLDEEKREKRIETQNIKRESWKERYC